MTETTGVRRITHMQFDGNADDKRVALSMTDETGEARSYLIDPATLRAFLAPMISLAASWSGDPQVNPQSLTGTQNALPANKILFARGRDDTEGAVRVFLGKDLDLTFLMPLRELVPAFQLFAKNIAFTAPPGTKTN